MLRTLSVPVLFAAVILSACSRAAVAPSVEPAGVAVEVALARSGASQDRLVVVPRAALVTVDASAGSAVVYVVQGDRAMRRSVAIGSVGDDDVEIVSGIAAGEEVVIARGVSDLPDGGRVRTVSRSGT
jgi:multidrug efflux pump subunit AcrA (membrane-fusion protein)